ncbi:thiamine-monophosphate kinase [Thermocladium modestius]|uniref:Thiamine-monophosphate kinase n=1 Tax=Thermocladium modestius TaxID=62609 RepID=A0A830H0V6_9CREN|nr:AIR synthase related protein [Thermocladium modestius]GGP22483.1 thiamine-monophosphate kinase [Thermocladium modestius]
MKLWEIGEEAVLERIRREAGVEDNDVSYVRGKGGDLLIIKIDGGAFSRTKMEFMTLYDVGWRTTVGALSDVFVKLGRPMAIAASITLRRDAEEEDAVQLMRGVRDAGSRYGAPLVGGDLNEGEEGVIDVAVIGAAEREVGRRPRPGDSLVTLPLFGYNGLAFKLWRERAGNPAVARGVEMLRRPELPLQVYGDASLADCLDASMDSSDGLGRVLHVMGRSAKIIVTSLPAPRDVVEAAVELGIPVEEAVFNGGEEYLPVFAVRRDCVNRLRGMGMVEFAEVEEGSGVYYGGEPLQYRGWEYFTQ